MIIAVNKKCLILIIYIYLFQDCRQLRSLAAGTSSAVKLSRFFDKVIEMRYHARENLTPFNVSDKRSRIYSTSPLLTSPKLYHND